MDFIAGRLRFAFYVRKGIANIPVSKEGTYSRRLGSYGLVGLIRDRHLRRSCGWVVAADAPPTIGHMHVSDFFKK
jgi:hypothetical protein